MSCSGQDVCLCYDCGPSTISMVSHHPVTEKEKWTLGVIAILRLAFETANGLRKRIAIHLPEAYTFDFLKGCCNSADIEPYSFISRIGAESVVVVKPRKAITNNLFTSIWITDFSGFFNEMNIHPPIMVDLRLSVDSLDFDSPFLRVVHDRTTP